MPHSPIVLHGRVLRYQLLKHDYTDSCRWVARREAARCCRTRTYVAADNGPSFVDRTTTDWLANTATRPVSDRVVNALAHSTHASQSPATAAARRIGCVTVGGGSYDHSVFCLMPVLRGGGTYGRNRTETKCKSGTFIGVAKGGPGDRRTSNPIPNKN